MPGRRNETFDQLVNDEDINTAAAILEQVRVRKIKVHPFYTKFAKVLIENNSALINEDKVFADASNDEICIVMCVVTDRLAKRAASASASEKKSYARALYKMVVSQPAKLSEEDKAYAALSVRVHTRSLVKDPPTAITPIRAGALFYLSPSNCSDHQISWGSAVKTGGETLIAAGLAHMLGEYVKKTATEERAQTGGSTSTIGAAISYATLATLYKRYRERGHMTTCITVGCTPDTQTYTGKYCVACDQLVESLQTSRVRRNSMTTAGWVDFLMQQFAMLTSKRPSGCVISLEALAVLSLLAHTARNRRRLAGALDSLLEKEN